MPIARFQMQDGRVARFEVPEGTTPEQAQSMMQQALPTIPSEAQQSPKPQERSLGQEFLRQAGLTARAGVQGVAAVPGMVNDALGAGYNAVADTVGIPGYRFGNTRDAIDAALTKAGLPEPETATERVVQDVTGAMAGQGGVIAGAKLLSNAASPITQRIAQLTAQHPTSQVVAAAGGAGGTGAAREAGADPATQMVAGLAGGMVAPLAADATGRVARRTAAGIKAIVDPFTQAGRERVVGTTLHRLAAGPQRAMNGLDADEIVPGSRPTTAQATRDEGLLIAERGLASSNQRAGALLARRSAEQNQARNTLLSSIAGDDEAIAAAKAARDAGAGAMREGAFAQKKPVDVAPVLQKIDQIAASPVGKRETVSGALAWLKGRLAGITDPEELYAVRQDIGDVLGGKLQGEKANLKLASGQLIEVRKALDDAIESGAPGFKEYLTKFAADSKPINQMETLQGIQNKVLNAGTDALTGERIMSPAKFYNAVTKNKTELSKVLTPMHMEALEKIGRDLDQGALSVSSGKAAGSNTMQNLSTAHVLGRLIGAPAAESSIGQNLARPLGWLNKLNEDQLQEMLTDAMLEPKFARQLMQKATPVNVKKLGDQLKEWWFNTTPMQSGGAIGTAVTAGSAGSPE